MKLDLFGISLCLLAVLLIACQPDETLPDPPPTPTASSPTATLPPSAGSTPSSPTLPPPATPPPGGTALLGLVGQPDSLNPILDSEAALRELTPLLFESLLRVDPQTAELRPGLAQSWEYLNNDNQWEVIFHLPPNLQWSNGQPLTAADIAASLRATQHPALAAFSDIQGVDDQTLALTFEQTNCSAVTELARLPLISAQAITATVPLGSGPFVVAEWPDNRRTLTLARNPVYHAAPPPVAGLVIRFLRADELAIAQTEGQFDLIGPSSLLQEPLAPRFERLTYPLARFFYVAVNFEPPEEEALDENIREALIRALDRETILEEALAGEGHLLAGSLLPGHWAANETLSLPPYDPEGAAQRLQQAGLRDSDGDGWLERAGERLTLRLRVNGADETQQNLAWLISSYYRALGIETRAEGTGFDSVVDDLFSHGFDIALFGWPIPPDPDQRRFWHSTENSEGFGLNVTSYSNPQADRLLEEANRVPGCELTERAELYRDLQALLAETRPVDFLLAPHQHLLVADRLQGIQPGPFAPLTWNVGEWSLRN